MSGIQNEPPRYGVSGRLILYYLEMVFGQKNRFYTFKAIIFLAEERRRSEQLRKTDIQDLS